MSGLWFEKKMRSAFRRAINYVHAFQNMNISELVNTRPIYLFNHIPKCGGTSLLRVFESWFIIDRDYSPHDLKFKSSESLNTAFLEFKDRPKSLLSNPPWKLVSGHYHENGVRLHQRYPFLFENPRVRLITFLRDPLEHKISLYYHGIKKGHNYVKNYTLNDFVLSESNRNFFAKTLGCSDENYKEILKQYFFVGVVEQMEDSINALAIKLNRGRVLKVPHVNTSPRDGAVLGMKSLRDEFAKANELDYKIYELAAKLAK